jgi:hypothetical protein
MLVAAITLLASAAASTGAARSLRGAEPALIPPPTGPWCYAAHGKQTAACHREFFRATFEGRQETKWTLLGEGCNRGSGSQTLEFATPKPVLAALGLGRSRALLYDTGIEFDYREANYEKLPVASWKVTRQATFACANDEIHNCGTRSYKAALAGILYPGTPDPLSRSTRLYLFGGPDQVASQRRSVLNEFSGCPVFPDGAPCLDADCTKKGPVRWFEQQGNLLADNLDGIKNALDGSLGRGPLYSLANCRVPVVRIAQPGFTLSLDQQPFVGRQVEWHSSTTVRWTLTLRRIGCSTK